MQTIKGLGGVGKTQLALAYAYTYSQKYPTAIWLINAETRLSAHNSFLQLAEHFGLPLSVVPSPEELAQQIKQWLDTNKGWLLILDNMETMASVSDYLPQKSKGRIIATTRNQDVGLGASLDLAVFGAGEAQRFMMRRFSNSAEGLCEHYAHHDFEQTSPQLAHRLGYLPLALEQACAYIIKNRRSITHYLQLLAESGLAVFAEELSLPEHYNKADDFHKIVSTTVHLSYNNIINEASRQLINLFAYLAPDAIPITLFSSGKARPSLPQPLQGELEQLLTTDRVVSELFTYSLVGGHPDNMSIHRLVQEVLRESHVDAPINYAWVGLMLMRVSINYDWLDVAALAGFRQLAEHAYSVTSYFCKPEIQDLHHHDPLIFVLNSLAYGYRYETKYSESLACYQKALALQEARLSKNDPIRDVLYYNIGWSFDHVGDFEQALDYYHRSLAIAQTIHGREGLATASCYNALGTVYEQLGHYKKAMDYLKRAAFIQKQHSDYKTAEEGLSSTYNNMAIVFQKQQRYDLALDYHARDLRIMKRLFGDRPHPDVATSRKCLGVTLAAMGYHELALKNFTLAKEINLATLGPEHTQTLALDKHIEKATCLSLTQQQQHLLAPLDDIISGS